MIIYDVLNVWGIIIIYKCLIINLDLFNEKYINIIHILYTSN